jgi:YegS/Rv2252/BmrU family lipid kinase
VRKQNHLHVRTCVIFNPAARGNKARRFRRWLDSVAAQCTLKPTAGPGDAQLLATQAVSENFDLIVAGGGDGTVNEVLNGIADAPDGLTRSRLGVLPLGTVNVFAKELKIPAKIPDAWEILQRGRELKIDLPRVEFSANGKTERRFFIQLAGAGLDARAIELVSWQHKKKIGPLAYVVAGFKALAERKPQIKVRADGQEISGEMILVGNGKLYGGSFEILPAADLQDGLLHVCALPRANFLTLARCAPGFLFKKKLPEKMVQRLRAKRFDLTSETPAAFELDGEWVGNLPATFSVEQKKLRVIVP